MCFRNKYDFLSNMFESGVSINIDGKPFTFTCVESAFHALKCPSRANEFMSLSGREAKKLSREVKLMYDWPPIRVSIMENLVRIKFLNKELANKLVEVDKPIVEHNRWHDEFWGVSYGKGENVLGQILEQIKKEIIEGTIENNVLCNFDSATGSFK